MSHSDNIRARIRNYRRPSELATVVAAFSRTFGLKEEDIGFLPLIDTERLQILVGNRLKSSDPKWEIIATDKPTIELRMKEALAHISSLYPNAVLFHRRDRDVGALLVPVDSACRSLWDLKQNNLIDDFALIDLTANHGLYMDFGFYTSDGHYYPDGICQIYFWK